MTRHDCSCGLMSVRMVRRLGVAVCVILLTRRSATAQNPLPSTPASPTDASARIDDVPFAPFVRSSHFRIGWPAGAMYEGEISVPVFLRSRTSELRTVRSADDTSGWSGKGSTFAFTPRFVLRQLKAASRPVQAPTFNPAFEWVAFSLAVTKAKTSSRLFPFASPPNRVGYLSATHFRLAHYSNGQAGCLYANQHFQERNNPCLPIATSADTLNTKDGSFSTHYVEIGHTRSALLLDGDLAERALHAVSLAVRSYPGGWVAQLGGMDAELARTYGRWTASSRYELRTRASVNHRVPFRSRRVDYRATRGLILESEFAPFRAAGYAKWRGSAEAFISFPGLYGFGAAVRYTSGWDYYNVAFGSHSYPAVSLSLMFDHTRAIALTATARRKTAQTLK
jgi:hypothetical protein